MTRLKYFILGALIISTVALAQGYMSQLNVGNIRLTGNTVSTQNTNGDLTFDPNGTGSVLFTDLTASRVLYLNGSKKLTSSAVSDTELGYLSGATSTIQTQLNAKISTTLGAVGSTPNANGATVSGTTLNLEPASASFPGVVTTGSQVFAGGKQFNGVIGMGGAVGTGTLKVQANGVNYDSALSLFSSNGTKKFQFYPENNGYFYYLPEGLTIFPWMHDNGGQMGIGTGSPEAQLTVGVAADVVQFSVRANATQTNNLAQFKNTSSVIAAKIDAAGSGWFNKLMAGSTAAFSSVSAGIELLSTTSAVLLSRLTTAQKNALTAVNGMILYDSDLARFEGRKGGSWLEVQVGTVSIASGGTGQTTKVDGFDALSPSTTKGDIIVSDGTDNIRVAVGSNTQVLTADSSQASGIKWAAPASAPSVAPPTVQRFTSGSGTYNKNYTFVITAGSATVGATYTNNAVTFTVYATVASATQVVMSGSGAPAASGTLTKATGTGDATLTFSEVLAPRYVRFRLAGGGGGGGAGGSSAGSANGTAGGNTTVIFGTLTIAANGGLPGAWNGGGGGGAGGSASVGSTAMTVIANSGGAGGGTWPANTESDFTLGGIGGSNALGGYGVSGAAGAGGGVGIANTGGGGGGGGGPNTTSSAGGPGGGAGAYVEALVASPAATYTYAVGAGGTGETGGTSAGGAGVAGIIVVEEYYQ